MSTTYPVYSDVKEYGETVQLELLEQSTELRLRVEAHGVIADSREITPDGLAVLIANLVRPYIYQYPGAEGRALVNKVKARLEDVLRGH